MSITRNIQKRSLITHRIQGSLQVITGGLEIGTGVAFFFLCSNPHELADPQLANADLFAPLVRVYFQV
jgi:hypothetical protein